MVMPAAYVTGRLAGLKAEDAFIDVTYLHFSCLADARRRAWSEELLRLFGVPGEKLPRIVEPWEVVGRLSPEMAGAMGLPSGLPLVAGAGDQAAAMLGAGVVRPGMVYDAAGTASVLAACTAEFAPDSRRLALLTARMVPAGLWYAIGYINGGGLNLRWFRDLVQRLGGGRVTDYAELDEWAARAEPGSGGLIFVPHLGGRVCPNQPDVRGGWLGLTWSHGVEHLYRALLESVAYEYAFYLDIERELIPSVTFNEVRVVGGGSRSAVWNQIKADVLGIPYVQLNVTEAAALGAAILAGHGVGVFEDWEASVARFTRPVRRFEPDGNATARYRPLAAYYRSLLEEHEALWRQLSQARTSGT